MQFFLRFVFLIDNFFPLPPFFPVVPRAGKVAGLCDITVFARDAAESVDLIDPRDDATAEGVFGVDG